MGRIANAPPRGPHNDRGFTLMEVVIGMAILLVLVNFAMPPIARTIRSVRLETTRSSLAADLGRARIEAMKRNQVVDVTIISRTEYDIDFVGVRRLENGVAFEAGPTLVQFAPFGSTLTGPAQFVLVLGGETKTVSFTASGLPVF